MSNQMSINRDTCSSCGLCARICPNRIIKKVGEADISIREDRRSLCLACGQCMAICPTQSIVVDGLTYEKDFFSLPLEADKSPSFLEMIRTRRAIRTFEDQPVPKELLEQVVQAMAFAPPGFTPIQTEVVVVQDTTVIRCALPEMTKVYDRLVRAMSHPVTRFFVRLKVGRAKFRTLRHHVVPMMKSRLPELIDGTDDTITRYAPAMLILHAHRDAENHEEDIHIALSYGFLAAHALGLGASAMSLIPPAIQNSSVLRNLFSIPDSNVVVGSIILGFPKHRYQRGIQRSLKGVTWI